MVWRERESYAETDDESYQGTKRESYGKRVHCEESGRVPTERAQPDLRRNLKGVNVECK